MKNAWPVKAQALGGRHYRGDNVDQNFDIYAVEYTFADGTKLIMDGRCMAGAASNYHSYAHGTKGMRGHLQAMATAGPVQHLQGPNFRRQDDLGVAADTPIRIPIKMNGMILWTPSATTSPSTR